MFINRPVCMCKARKSFLGFLLTIPKAVTHFLSTNCCIILPFAHPQSQDTYPHRWVQRHSTEPVHQAWWGTRCCGSPAVRSRRCTRSAPQPPLQSRCPTAGRSAAPGLSCTAWRWCEEPLVWHRNHQQVSVQLQSKGKKNTHTKNVNRMVKANVWEIWSVQIVNTHQYRRGVQAVSSVRTGVGCWLCNCSAQPVPEPSKGRGQDQEGQAMQLCRSELPFSCCHVKDPRKITHELDNSKTPKSGWIQAQPVGRKRNNTATKLLSIPVLLEIKVFRTVQNCGCFLKGGLYAFKNTYHCIRKIIST